MSPVLSKNGIIAGLLNEEYAIEEDDATPAKPMAPDEGSRTILMKGNASVSFAEIFNAGTDRQRASVYINLLIFIVLLYFEQIL